MDTIPAIVTFFVPVLAAYGLGAILGSRDDREMQRQRAGWTVASFRGEFAGDDYEPDAVRRTFERFSELATFPVRRNDDIFDTLGVDKEDFVELAIEDAKACGVDIAAYDNFTVETIGDYVCFLSHAIRRQPVQAPPRRARRNGRLDVVAFCLHWACILTMCFGFFTIFEGEGDRAVIGGTAIIALGFAGQWCSWSAARSRPDRQMRPSADAA